MSVPSPTPSAFPVDLEERIAASRVIAVVVIEDADHAVPLARALLEGGIRVMELTLRTPAAMDAVRAIIAETPEMTVGCGTVLNRAQVDEVTAAGAAFAVAPGFNPVVVRHAREAGLPFAPGVLTPSEIERALEEDCRLLKFFPAETSGGLKHLEVLAAPFTHLGVRFIPLGGLNLDNAPRYLSSPLIAAVGGSWLAPKDAIAAARWDQIRDNARTATASLA